MFNSLNELFGDATGKPLTKAQAIYELFNIKENGTEGSNTVDIDKTPSKPGKSGNEGEYPDKRANAEGGGQTESYGASNPGTDVG